MSEQTEQRHEHIVVAWEMERQQVEAELERAYSKDRIQTAEINTLGAANRELSAYITKLEFERDTYKASLVELEEVVGGIPLDQVRQVSPATATALELMRASKKSNRRKSNAGR